MRWKGRRESENVEDRENEPRRGFPFPGGGRGFPFPRGGGMKIPIPGGGAGGGGLIGLLVVVGIMLLLGVDPRILLDGGSGGGIPFPDGGRQIQLPRDRNAQGTPVSDPELKQFVSVVLADTEDVWTDIFKKLNRPYDKPKLTLYRDSISSGCGYGMSQMGPFYCPNDAKVYIDLRFYEELKTRFRAPGDFAQAYVIAHEVGHHVQTLLGITQKVQSAKSRSGSADANAIQVRMELQADCFAGLWANHSDRVNKILEPGDIDEALRAASAIGDDTIQRKTQGRVAPESFTHGSSEQRMRWFKRGFDNGTLASCDTFNAQSL
jgi:hypothetical protein